nr:protein mono-ADP-ribosyltransferase TIPARP-like [Nerophis lumbriciformis]
MENTVPPGTGSSQDTPPWAYQSSSRLLPTQVKVTATVTPDRLSHQIAPKYPPDDEGSTWSAAHNASARFLPPLPTPQAADVAPVSSYHIWRNDHVDICDEFLLGLCPRSDSCGMHHTPYPFFWQLYNSITDSWVFLKSSAQRLLERMYCNVNQETVMLKHGRVVFTLNLEDMEIVDYYVYTSARRLYNSENRLWNPYFPAVWRIYWWDDYNDWVEYNEEVSELLRAKMATKEVECSFTVDSRVYRVDFITMTQCNVQSGFVRDIRIRPLYRSIASLHPHLKLMALQHLIYRTGGQMEPLQAVVDPKFSMVPMEDTLITPFWRLGVEADSCLVDVPVGTEAFFKVQKFFYDSLPETKVDIVVIQQVQNFLHWDNYQRKKKSMVAKYADLDVCVERHLFHGTSMEAAESICRNNFDPRVTRTDGRSLGYVTYFSPSASVSHVFAVRTPPDGLRHMFLAKVLVGRVYYHHTPPPPECIIDFYDTCVNCESNPTKFAIYNSSQCYPSYLIRYKDLDGIVEL